MTGFWLMARRDVMIAYRIGGGGALATGFFVIAITLFPLGIGPNLLLLGRIAPGILWASALLACLLSLDRMFQADEEDGSLDQLLLSPLPLTSVVGAKVLAHWLTTGLPLLMAAPWLSFMLSLDVTAINTLLLSLLLGTPALSLIGAVGAAVTVGVRRGGMLLTVLVLPLYIPVLVFGATAVEASVFGLGASAHLMILGAILLATVAGCPAMAASALRLHASS